MSSHGREGWMTRRVLIMGAAGRDFHNFNTVYRDRDDVDVVAFTATQIPFIENRTYPPELAGRGRADAGVRTVVVRHPMPSGALAAQRVQRFASDDALERAHATIEEREEYEPHLLAGSVVYAGVDYAAILERAQAECE